MPRDRAARARRGRPSGGGRCHRSRRGSRRLRGGPGRAGRREHAGTNDHHDGNQELHARLPLDRRYVRREPLEEANHRGRDGYCDPESRPCYRIHPRPVHPGAAAEPGSARALTTPGVLRSGASRTPYPRRTPDRQPEPSPRETGTTAPYSHVRVAHYPHVRVEYTVDSGPTPGPRWRPYRGSRMRPLW
ncbi:MAG: hypothetical protein AVDCRST_MAG88-4299 [uncultured Thermomicrobiales bacterium]|uniref:Uncharacterized protein n=1 Tax=uncultured Thermomicrobiales bacterium TaxID=1645740 RepID=A0A6J4VSP2_9BACT|nr:MAG: hypothetical protein AVDCRST_MAG88-4299 [uncultured Thermomicrobiales bacterium]